MRSAGVISPADGGSTRAPLLELWFGNVLHFEINNYLYLRITYTLLLTTDICCIDLINNIYM